MYDEVEERITKELDVVKLLKKVNDQKIALKATLMDPDLKFQIAHSYQFVLDLDSDSSSTSEDEADQIVVAEENQLDQTIHEKRKGKAK